MEDFLVSESLVTLGAGAATHSLLATRELSSSQVTAKPHPFVMAVVQPALDNEPPLHPADPPLVMVAEENTQSRTLRSPYRGLRP